jgi:hypothetical protein
MPLMDSENLKRAANAGETGAKVEDRLLAPDTSSRLFSGIRRAEFLKKNFPLTNTDKYDADAARGKP